MQWVSSAPSTQIARATAVFFALFGLCLCAHASGNNTHSNGNNHNWDNASSWDNGKPGANDLAEVDTTLSLTTTETASALSFTAGSITVTGDLTLSGTGSAGASTWSGGDFTGSGRVKFNKGVSISGSSKTANGGTKLDFDDASIWSASAIQTGGTSTELTNKSTGTFTTTFDGTISDTSGGSDRAKFTNNGSFVKNGTAGDTDVQTTFANTGTVNASTGRIKLSGGGSSSNGSTLTAGNGASIQLTGNTFTFDSGANLTSSGTGKVEVSGASTNFNGVSGNSSGRLKVSSGTATLGTTTNNTLVELEVVGGTVNGSGKFTVGSLKLGGGEINGAEISSSGAGDITGTTIRGGSKVTLGSGGTGQTTTWSTGDIATDGASTEISNVGTFSTAADLTITKGANGQAKFKNNGNFNKTGGSGDTEVQATFENTGTINVASGGLKLSGGGSSSGHVALANGAKLKVSGSGFSFTDGADLDGSGEIDIDGTVSFSGTTHGSAKHKIDAGDVNFAGTHTVTGSLDLAGGTLHGLGNLIVDSALNLTGGDLNGLVVRGKGNASIKAGGTLQALNGAQLELEGATSWEGNTIQTAGSSTRVTNKIGGVFSTNFDGTIGDLNNGSGKAKFTNNGQFIKNGGGGGVTDIQSEFENTGSVSISQGRLQLKGGGNGNGGFHIGNGAALKLTDAGFTFNDGAAIDGDGTIEFVTGNHSFNGNTGGNAKHSVTGGIATFNGNHSAGGFDLGGGKLNGNGNLAVGNQFNWTDGDLDGVTVNSNHGASIAGGSPRIYNNGKLNLNGNTTWTSGTIGTGGGAKITNKNGGTFVTNFDGSITNSNSLPGSGRGTFTNQGTFRKTGGTATTTIETDFVNNNGALSVESGKLKFTGSFTQTGGSISILNTSTLQFDQGLKIDGGTLGGSGLIVGNVDNSGTISPGFSPGQINITGNLSLGSTSTLALQIGGGTPGITYDLLAVSGNAVLGGNLTITFLNNFAPSVLTTDTFTVLTTGTGLTGAFSNVAPGQRLTTTDGLGSFLVTSSGGAISLGSFQAIPEPTTWALMLFGIPLIVRRLKRRA